MSAEVFKLKTNEDPFYPAVFQGEDYRFGEYVKILLSEKNPKDDFLDAVVMCAADFDRLNLEKGGAIRFRIASTNAFILMYRDVSAQPDTCILIEDVGIIRPSFVTELKPKANPSNRPRNL